MARGPPAAAAAAHGPRLAGVGRALLLVAATATFLPAAESSCPRGAPSPPLPFRLPLHFLLQFLETSKLASWLDLTSRDSTSCSFAIFLLDLRQYVRIRD